MTALGEPQSWGAARQARLAQQFPVEFGTSDARTVLGVDAMRVNNGQAPSAFSQAIMRLAVNAGQDDPRKNRP